MGSVFQQTDTSRARAACASTGKKQGWTHCTGAVFAHSAVLGWMIPGSLTRNHPVHTWILTWILRQWWGRKKEKKEKKLLPPSPGAHPAHGPSVCLAQGPAERQLLLFFHVWEFLCKPDSGTHTGGDVQATEMSDKITWDKIPQGCVGWARLHGTLRVKPIPAKENLTCRQSSDSMF